MITFLASIPGLLYVGFFHIVDDAVIDAHTTAGLTSDVDTPEEHSVADKTVSDPEKGVPISIAQS